MLLMVAAQVNAMHPQNTRKFISGLMSVYLLTARKIKIWAALKNIISSIDFIFFCLLDFVESHEVCFRPAFELHKLTNVFLPSSLFLGFENGFFVRVNKAE